MWGKIFNKVSKEKVEVVSYGVYYNRLGELDKELGIEYLGKSKLGNLIYKVLDQDNIPLGYEVVYSLDSII